MQKPPMIASHLPRLLTVFALVCLATLAMWFKLQMPTTGIDDANIFFAYAQNLAAGKGFVFNPGGEHVEGFTSLAWVLICTAAYRVAGSLEWTLLVINVLLVTLTIVCGVTASTLSRTSNAATLSRGWAAVFTVLLLTDGSYVAWNTFTLMETALWTALLTMSALLVLDGGIGRVHAYGFAAISAVMVATRPEALVWAPLMIFLFYVSRKATAGHQLALRSATPAAMACALTVCLMTLFRMWYFGYPLPNTYYAKISPSFTYRTTEGAQYLWAYLSSGPVALACFLAVIASGIHLLKVTPRDTRTVALSVMAAAGLTLPVYMGGDHFGGFRFYQPVYPIFLLALINGLRFVVPRHLPRSPGRGAKAALAIAALGVSGIVLNSRIVDWRNLERRTALRREFSIAEMGRDRGRHAEKLFAGLQQRPSIGTITVGGLKYAYSGDVVDLMGLNNTRMAHNDGARIGIRSHAAFEKRTFYELRPMLVLPLVQYSDLAVQATRIWFVDVALKGLVDDKPFRDRYRLAEVRRATPSGVVALAGWYDRAFLDRLAQLKEFHITESPTLPD